MRLINVVCLPSGSGSSCGRRPTARRERTGAVASEPPAVVTTLSAPMYVEAVISNANEVYRRQWSGTASLVSEPTGTGKQHPRARRTDGRQHWQTGRRISLLPHQSREEKPLSKAINEPLSCCLCLNLAESSETSCLMDDEHSPYSNSHVCEAQSSLRHWVGEALQYRLLTE